MRMMFKAFGKKLFGFRYERLGKTAFICFIVFWGLHISGIQIEISPRILYLMVSTFTAGVMWQALSSIDHAENMKNMFMTPLEARKFVFAYVSALGAYSLLIRTGMLLAVVFAVAPWSSLEMLSAVFYACHAILITACLYSGGKRRRFWVIWAAAFLAAIVFIRDIRILLLPAAGIALSAVVFLRNTDAYSFYPQTENRRRVWKSGHTCFVWRYLFRYLMDHKNYLINTAVMWGVACALPAMFKQMESMSALPVGFAVLSINTPVCILLSCDPALEQAVRFLPGQKRAFCVPYCFFIFICNLAADLIYLCSWQLRAGGVNRLFFICMAVLFALQSAAASVLLEWFYPVRNWKTESDLWRHPRKYAVPAVMMLAAGMAGVVPWLVCVLAVLFVTGCVVLLLKR